MKNRTTTQPNRARGGRPPAPSRTIQQAAETGLTRQELATLCRLPATTIDGWRRRGCPTIGSGRFDLGSVLQWVRMQAAEQAVASRTTEASDKALADWRGARAAREELRLAHDRGEVVDRNEVVEFASRTVLATRNRLLLATKKLTARLGPLAGPNGFAIVEDALHAEVVEILNDFARGLDDVPAAEGAASAALDAATTTATPPPPAATTEPLAASPGTEPDGAENDSSTPADDAGNIPTENEETNR